MKNREKFLDILRGIAIILIIIGHGPKFNDTFHNFIWTFHVPLFFLISGYTYKVQNEKDYAIKKFKRLMIPYIFTIFLLILANIIKDYTMHNLNIVNVVKRQLIAGIYGSCVPLDFPFKIPEIGAIWFLGALFFSSIIFNSIMNQDEKYHIPLIVTLMIIGFKLNDFIWLPFSINSACVCTVFLYIGYIAKKENIFNKQCSLSKEMMLKLLLLIVSITCIYFNGAVYVGTNTYTFGLLSLFGSVAISYFIANFSKLISKIPIISNFLIFLGMNSMIILSMHLIELNFINWSSITLFSTGNLLILNIYIYKLLYLIICIYIVNKTILKKVF